MSAVLEPMARSGSASVNEKVEDCGTNLCVEREDIQFYNVAPDRLRIEVTVRNMGYAHSEPETMQLQFAAFGAFVPWTPLQKLQVPQIKAGESKLVSTNAWIRPDGALVALDGSTQSADRTLPARPWLYRFTKNLLDNSGNKSGWNALNLPASLYPSSNQRQNRTPWDMRLHQGRSVHWVGNINVLIGNVDVERHTARAFRIYPGLSNRSVFFLGDKVGESYSFQMSGDGAEWPTKLIRIENMGFGFMNFSLGGDYPGKQILPNDWKRVDPIGLIGVDIRPPEYVKEGGLGIHVCRKSDNRTAVVEFDFSETALGSGCYTVQGS
ncbi:MAG: hypothetical protein VCA36_00680 [Opitutales bacterium]